MQFLAKVEQNEQVSEAEIGHAKRQNQIKWGYYMRILEIYKP